jgi:GAF domain-containing protein
MVRHHTGPTDHEHASLRTIAGLVAGGAPASEVFAAVAREVARVSGSELVLIFCFEPDDGVSIAGAWGAGPHPFQPGTRWSLEGSQIAAAIRSSGTPVRVDDFGDGSGPIQAAVRDLGLRSGAGAPIVVDGELWGVMVAAPPAGSSVPDDVEQRLGEFTDLVAMAIASATSREALARVAAEQAAMRRVATHVARESSPEEVFAVVADEAAGLIGSAIGLLRFERDGTATLLAQSNTPWDPVPLGTRLTLEGDNILGAVLERGEPVRFDDSNTPTGSVSDFARVLGVRCMVATPVVVEGRRWGVLLAATADADPLPAGTESRLEQFTELLVTALANAQARGDLEGLAEEQAALRRLATQVARGASADESFEAVIAEIGRLLQADAATLARYEEDGAVVMRVGSWSRSGVPRVPTGSRYQVVAGSLGQLILSGRGPARIEDVAQYSTPLAWQGRSVGWRSGVGAPVTVDGRLWGFVAVMSTTDRTFPSGTESQLAAFAQLLPIAIANAQSREDLAVVAQEHAALRGIATLVAEGRPEPEVLATVAEEVGRVLRVDGTRIVRFDPDGTVAVVASWGVVAADIPVGTKWAATGNNVVTRVLRSGQPARVEAFDDASGPIGDALRQAGVRSAVGIPIVVEAQPWGAIVATSLTAERLHANTEARISRFAFLIATAIANVEARTELAASRKRLAAASVEERRRVVRDLHDGAQQRLVHTVITLKLARDELLERGDATAAELLVEPLSHAQRATDELRELAHGILPAVLTQGGLRAGVESLATRSLVPTDVDVLDARLPAPVETTAYFVVAEALTNVAKHSGATRVHVAASADDGVLHVDVRDDGHGGARPDGSGLVGLADRLAAVDGRLRIDSPRGEGTLIAAEIPIARTAAGQAETASAPPSA